MAKNDVKVEISTEKKGTGAEDTAKALGQLEKKAVGADAAAVSLRKDSEKLKKTNVELSKALGKEAGKLEQVAKQARKTGAEYDEYGKSAKKVDAGNKKMTKSGKKTGLAFLEVSRAVEDSQYGISGVLNNIPQIVTLFGGTAGLAAAISVAAVSASVFGGSTQKAAVKAKTAFDGLDTKFQKSEQSIKDADEAVLVYSDSLDAINDKIDLQNAKLKLSIQLGLERAKHEALIANNALELERLSVIGDSSLSGVDKEKKLADIEQRKIDVATANQKEAQQGKIETLLSSLNGYLEKKSNAEEALAAVLADKNDSAITGEGAELLQKLQEDAAKSMNTIIEDKVIPSLDSSLGFFGDFSNDKVEDPLNKLITEFSKLDDEEKANPEVAAGFLNGLEKILDPLVLGSRSEGSKARSSVKDALVEYKGYLRSKGAARDATEAQDKYNGSLKKTRDDLAVAKTNVVEKVGGLRAEIDSAVKVLELIGKESAGRSSIVKAQSVQKQKVAAAKDAKDELGEITDGVLKEAEKSGRGKESLEGVKAKLKHIEKVLAESLKSGGGIDGKEQQKLESLLVDLKRDEGVKSQSQLSNIKQLTEAISTNAEITTRLLTNTTVKLRGNGNRLRELERVQKMMNRDADRPKT